MGHEEHNFDEVGKLLGTLGRVEPPGDFDVRVRARIAAGRTARPSLLSLVRVAVPAALLLSVGGYFGYTSLYGPDDIPAVAETRVVPDPPPAFPTVPVDDKVIVAPDQMVARAPSSNGSSSPPPVRTSDTILPPAESGGGSLDFSFPTARRRLPRGLDPDRVITNTNISTDVKLSAVTVLRMLGISASCSAAGCRAGSVSANSVAGNSGIRPGDVIEAMDGTTLNENVTFSGQFSAATVRVRRNGSTITISLRP